MEITQRDVEKVAQLARLAVTPGEKETFAKQLTQILSHVDTLNQYDTTGIEPTTTVMGHVNVFREDPRSSVAAYRESFGECAGA